VPAYYRVETCHQEYFPQHPNQGYCAAVIGPKVAKFRKTWADYRKA
jgi:peptide-methionine (S)-S-oxide reductase